MEKQMKSVLITTQHRGVFYAEVPEDMDLTPKEKLLDLKNCKMAIKWGTTDGLMQLCHTGPTTDSKISAPADIPVLHDITGVFSITAEAKQKWTSA